MTNGVQVNFRFSERDVSVLAQVWPRGASSGVRGGQLPKQGDVLPAWVTRENPNGTKNLHVLLDASIGHWVKNVTEGAGEGQWSALV